VRGEPIICTPEDAFRCFMGTGLDVLVVGNALLIKAKKSKVLATDYKVEYELD
jgi:carbamoyltransferase